MSASRVIAASLIALSLGATVAMADPVAGGSGAPQTVAPSEKPHQGIKHHHHHHRHHHHAVKMDAPADQAAPTPK